VGLGLGIILAGIVLLPVGLGLLIYTAATEPPASLEPGERARYPIDVTTPVETEAQVITLGVALDDGKRPLNVPLIDPRLPHGGWGRPRRLDSMGVRIGGGPIVGDGKYSGTGGVQVTAGRRVGPIVVGAAATFLGVSFSLGPELSVPIQLHGDLVELAPTVDAQVGVTLLGRYAYASPSGGLELTFPVQRRNLLGWDAPGLRFGVYGKGGPIWTDDGFYARWEVGVVMR
jgi:hypothetical protein